jgi:uncharacterized metal-binding protein
MFFKSSVANMMAGHFQIAFSEFDVSRICCKVTVIPKNKLLILVIANDSMTYFKMILT